MKNYKLDLVRNDFMQLLYSSKFFSGELFHFSYKLYNNCVLNIQYNTKNQRILVFVRNLNEKKDYQIIFGFIRSKLELDYVLNEIHKNLLNWKLVNNVEDIDFFDTNFNGIDFDNL